MSLRYRTILATLGKKYSPELQAIIDRANLEGFTLPSETTLVIIDVLIKAMITDGYWAKRDLILNFAYNDDNCREFSMINWKNPSGSLATEIKISDNLFGRSEEFNAGIWSKVSCPITTNSMLAPNGTTTADTINFTALTSRLQGNAVVIVGHKYNLSVYCKPDTLTKVGLGDNVNTTNGAIFDLTTLTVTLFGSGTNAIITAEPNGFYRCSVDLTMQTNTFMIRNHTGAIPRQAYFWGAQATIGYGLNPYLPTTDSFGQLQYGIYGFLGNNSNLPVPFINTNFNPTIGINQYTLNNASRDFVINNTITNSYVDSAGGTLENVIRLNNFANRINSGVNAVLNLFTATLGYKALNRINSTQIVSVNTSVAVTNTLNSTTMSNRKQHLFNSSFSGSAIYLTYYSMGAEVVTEGQLFRTAYNNYLTNIGLTPIA